MTRYRVEYTEIKPGGHQDRQCDMISGEVRDVMIYLSARRVVEGSVDVIEQSAKSDGAGVSLGGLGWNPAPVDQPEPAPIVEPEPAPVFATRVPTVTGTLAPFRWLAIRAGLHTEAASGVEIRKIGSAWGVFVPVPDGARYDADSRSGAGFNYHCGLAGKTLKQARSNVEWFLRNRAKSAPAPVDQPAPAKCVDCDAPAVTASHGIGTVTGAPEGQPGAKCARHAHPATVPARRKFAKRKCDQFARTHDAHDWFDPRRGFHRCPGNTLPAPTS